MGKRSSYPIRDTQGVADQFFSVFAAVRFGARFVRLAVVFFPGWSTLVDGAEGDRGGIRRSLFLSVVALRRF